MTTDLNILLEELQIYIPLQEGISYQEAQELYRTKMQEGLVKLGFHTKEDYLNLYYKLMTCNNEERIELINEIKKAYYKEEE